MSFETQAPPEKQSSPKHWIRQHWNLCLSGVVLVIVIIFVSSGVVTIHPGYIEEDKQATARLIQEFHARWNADQFEQIYSDADQVLQQYPGGRDGLLAAMRRSRKKYGLFEAVNSSEMNVLMRAPVEVRAVYRVRFETGNAVEAFVFVLRKDKYKLAHYEIFRETAVAR